MANSSLQGYDWNIPEELQNHLKRTINAYKGDKNQKGYQRLRNLVDSPKVSYEELKRIKNFFDSHKTAGVDYMDDKKQDTEFILNGGSKMRFWVNDTLNKAREGVKNPKEIKKNTGMQNQFIKTHDKQGISTDDVKIKNGKISSSSRHIYDNRGIQEMKMMESLINIFDKNKELWHTDK